MNCIYSVRLIKSRLLQYSAEKFENGVFTLKSKWKCFPSNKHRRNLKNQQASVVFDFCFSKTRAGKSHNYRKVIVSKTCDLKSSTIRVQMFATVIFPYLIYFTLFETNEIQSITAGQWIDACVRLITPGPRYTPEKFENGVFTLKTHQMSLVDTTQGNFEKSNMQSLASLDFALQEIPAWLSCCCRFEKFCFERFISNAVYKFPHISSVFLCLKLMNLAQSRPTLGP